MPDPGPASALRLLMARRGPMPAAALAQDLGVSVATLHRILLALEPGERLVAGRARRTRHALRRSLRTDRGPWPVYAVDMQGQACQVGELSAVQPQGCWLDLSEAGWPQPEEARDGWWPGLPYPLNDMRPQGYMGRLFARAEHAALGVSPDPRDWSDDDVLHVLLARGTDTSGNLVVGDAALRHWQQARLALAEPLASEIQADAYLALADQAVATGVPGSSAAGEFPKFAARRVAPAVTASATPHVLVKFSGAGESAAVQRWADLLVCEHLALTGLAALEGQAPPASRILRRGGRTFLEVERFDRHGEFGRSPLCTLASVNDAFMGLATSDWSVMARRLHVLGLLDEADAARIERLWWFGRLIANTDMHAGNLSFRPHQGRLALAPVYDMLPMLQAPLAGGEVATRAFEPPLPLPAQRQAWLAAFEPALAFWQAAAQDDRISEGFRSLCVQSAQRLQAVRPHA